MPRPSNCSGEALRATRSPTTPTRTSRTWIRARTKCSSTSLQALRRSKGVEHDSPPVHLGFICIVGRIDEERPKSAPLPQPYVKTQDPEWYAGKAARLRDELERRKAQIGRYRQAIEDARNLKTMTGGINLEEGDI